MPGVGKTTLANKIAKLTALPLIYKDAIKEILFDTIGTGDRQWSKKLGVSSYALMYYFIENFFKTSNSLVIESNFSDKVDSAKINKLAKKYHYQIVQIFCFADLEISYQRFISRHANGARHTGHTDHENINSYKENFANQNYRLNLQGKCISLDMNDFSKINIKSMIEEIKS